MTPPDKIIASVQGNMVIGEKTYPYGPWFAVDNPLRSSGVEYTRIDPNTRIVTVEQLERLELRLRYAGFARSADSIRAIIGEVL
jgi:hypothetical protein